MKNSDMNFRKYPVWNATSFSGISGKEDNLARRTKILSFLAEWFAVRKFNNFRIFWNFSLEISLPFVPVSKLSEFLVECKAPKNF